MNTVTLAELRALVLEQADMTGSTYVSTTTLDHWINSELSELHDLLVGSFADYYLSKFVINTVAGTESYLLPDDFYKLLKVFSVESDGTRKSLSRFTLEELSGLSNVVTSSGDASMYRVIGNRIHLAPRPSSVEVIEMWYVPGMVKLLWPASQVSVMVPVGWEDFVVCGAAARCLMKEESDPTPCMARKEQIRQRILDMASDRDEANVDRISDVYGRFGAIDDVEIGR